MKHPLVRSFFLLFSLLFLTYQMRSAHADELIVGGDNWPPFRMMSEERNSGIDMDMWQEIGQQLGLTVKFVKCPWGRCLKMMEVGTIDAMSGLAYRKERAEYIEYISTPYYTCSTAFYVKEGEEATVNGYEDLYNFHVGYVLHSAYFMPFDTDEKIQKAGVAKEEQLPKMLVNNHIPVFIGTDCQVDYDLQLNGLGAKISKANYKPENNVELYVGISKKSKFAGRLKVFDQTIIAILVSGFHDRVKQNYYTPQGP